MKVKMSGGPASVNLKFILLFIAIIIALGTLLYTQKLVTSLQTKERQIVELYANSLEYISNERVLDSDFTFIFENIIKRIDFPLILTDANDKVNWTGRGDGIKNLEIDSTLSPEKLEIFFTEKINELRDEHIPISVTYEDSVLLGRIYYGNSKLVEQLQYYPYMQIFVAVLFIIIAYFSFSYLKKSEQSNIWVGMAKETAHQLGTPISSLMGWSEILKINFKDPDKVIDVSDEMNSDLERLNKIASRFSKIGSKPELKDENIYSLIEKVIQYFHRRLPQSGNKVALKIEGDKNIRALINAELFEWVIENLIKNALDAIGKKTGTINFSISSDDRFVEIEIEDNGNGIDIKRRKDVFRPGYSTKKRGWGLGLSLSKRIVEDYHKGKIIVKQSLPGEGTIFRITLKRT